MNACPYCGSPAAPFDLTMRWQIFECGSVNEPQYHHVRGYVCLFNETNNLKSTVIKLIEACKNRSAGERIKVATQAQLDHFGDINKMVCGKAKP